MRYLKKFEKYSENNYDKYIDFDYIKNLSNSDLLNLYNKYKSANFDEDQEEAAISSLTHLRDYILQHSNNDKLILYRVINIKDINSFNKNNPGEHYVSSVDDIDSIFLYDIGLESAKQLYIIEVRVLMKYINFKQTILMRVFHPHEREISLLSDTNVELININKFEIR